MLRFEIALGFAVIAAMSVAQTSAPTVTYSSVAKPAFSILADIAKQTGEKMQIEDLVANDVLIVRFDKLPLPEALDKITEVLHAKWTSGQNGIYIGRDAFFDDDNEKEQQAKYKEKYEAMVKTRLDAAPKTPLTENSAKQLLLKLSSQTLDEPFSEDSEAKAERYERESPAGRLIDRILPLIDADVVAANRDKREIAFSNEPRPLQLPLNIPDETMSAIVEEQNLFTSAREQLAKTSPQSLDDDHRSIIPSNPRIIVALNPTLQSSFGDIAVYIVDDKDHILAGAIQNLPSSQPDLDDYQRRKQAALERFRKFQFAPVPLTGSALDLDRLADPRETLSPSLHDAMLDPVSIDPLSIFASRWILGAADQKNLNVVAWLSDRNSISFHRDKRTAVDPTDLLASLAENNSEDVSIDDKWLTISPEDPIAFERDMTDRRKLAAFMHHLDDDGQETLESTSELLEDKEKFDGRYFPYLWSKAFLGFDGGIRSSNISVLHIFRQLPESFMNRLLKGETLRLIDLPSDMQPAFFELFDNWNTSNMSGSSSEDPPVLNFDYTEALDSLDDARVRINAQLTNEDAIWTLTPNSAVSRTSVHSLQSAAEQLARNQAVGGVAASSGREFSVSIEWSSGATFGAKAVEFGKPGKFGALNDLPKAILDKLRPLIEQDQKFVRPSYGSSNDANRPPH